MQKSLQNTFVPVSRKRSPQVTPIYSLFVGLNPPTPGEQHFLGAFSVVMLLGAQCAGCLCSQESKAAEKPQAVMPGSRGEHSPGSLRVLGPIGLF